LSLYGQRYDVQLHELPASLTKLDSLQLEGMTLQLQPDVLRAVFPLTRLELSYCTLLDGSQGLAAVLAQLPDLEHLGVTVNLHTGRNLPFPSDVLPHLQNLTCLMLQGLDCRNRNNSAPSAALQPLQALTRLAVLQLGAAQVPYKRKGPVMADMLAGADQLTRLVVSGRLFDARALAGKSQLQHLDLQGLGFVGGPGVTPLLSELQHLTQLTYLNLSTAAYGWKGSCSTPAAYGNLTASSKLQHLDFSGNRMPAAAWQYVCPPGRVLPQLRHLDLIGLTEADTDHWSAPDTTALVRCCPGLQTLRTSMPCSTAQLAPLQQLTGLTTLAVGGCLFDDLEGVQALCQLTGLQRLELRVSRDADARVLQLTQLTRLTALKFSQRGGAKELYCHAQVS
jgi:hypothetical protein